MDDAVLQPAPASSATARPAVAVVGNPYSGRGANRQRVQRLLERLQASGVAARVAWEPAARHAMLADPDLARWCRCVVVAGGDGTVADVLNDLPDGASVPVATLPIGNENLFAREFGFEAPPERIAAAIARGRTRQVDLGTCNGRVFALMASAGFDAEVVHRVARWRVRPNGEGLRRVGRLNYGPRILAALGRYRYPRVRVEADGHVVGEGAHAFVFNLPQYAARLGICPEAAGDDGQLDWLVLERPGMWALGRYGLSVIGGRHLGRPDVRHGRAERIRITAASDGSVPAQVDGDPAGATPMAVAVRPGALAVVDVGADRAGDGA